MELQSPNEVKNLNKVYTNHFTYQNEIGLLDIQESFRWKKWRFNVGGTTQIAQVRLNNKKTIERNFQRNQLLFQPTLAVSVQLSDHQRLMFFYYGQQSLPSSEQFNEGYIQSSYRSFSRNVSQFYVTQNNNLQLNYNNTNWTKLYAFNLGISHNQNYFVNTSNFAFSELLSFDEQQPIATKLGQWSANCQLDRLIALLSTKIRFEGFVSQSDILNRVNGSALLPNYTQNFNGKIYAISAFDFPLNFQLSTRLNFNRVMNRSDKKEISSAKLFVPSVILKYQPLPKLTLRLTGEQLNWYNQQNRDVTNLLDLDIILHPEKSLWTFSMRGNNLLNTKAIYYTTVSNYAIFQRNYLLQPRWVSVSANRSF